MREATIAGLESIKKGKGYWVALYQRATREIQKLPISLRLLPEPREEDPNDVEEVQARPRDGAPGVRGHRDEALRERRHRSSARRRQNSGILVSPP